MLSFAVLHPACEGVNQSGLPSHGQPVSSELTISKTSSQSAAAPSDLPEATLPDAPQSADKAPQADRSSDVAKPDGPQPAKGRPTSAAKVKRRKAAIRAAKSQSDAKAGESSTTTPESETEETSEKPKPTKKSTKKKSDKTGVIAAPPTVADASVKKRHLGLIVAFFLLVVTPLMLAAYYLFAIAEDQYTSTVGFSVRSEDVNSSLDLISGLSSLSGTSSSDTDILYEFIQSQDLVQRIDEKLDLRSIYSKPDFDPIFAFDETGSIEDLLDYWKRMVRIFYDSGTGLIELRVHAFDPQDAQMIAREIFAESSAMINELSAIAREDATRYAGEELEKAVERLKVARQALTGFRSETQLVDPSADIQGQMGLLNSLEAQLAEAIIEMNLLRETTRAADPRIEQSERRIAVIEQLIEKERTKFGVGAGAASGGQDYSTLVGEYERLVVDREFAENAYVSALSAFDAAQAEARRQSRYLAAYTRPTLAESSGYPQRWLLTLLTSVFALLTWAIVVLIYYSVRDRR